MRAASHPRIVFSFGLLVRMPFTPLRHDPPVLQEADWKQVIGKVKATCETNGFEFRLSLSWPDYAATQVLALGGHSLHRLLLQLAAEGPMIDAPMPARSRAAVEEWIGMHRGELEGEKKKGHPFGFSFLDDPGNAGDALAPVRTGEERPRRRVRAFPGPSPDGDRRDRRGSTAHDPPGAEEAAAFARARGASPAPRGSGAGDAVGGSFTGTVAHETVPGPGEKHPFAARGASAAAENPSRGNPPVRADARGGDRMGCRGPRGRAWRRLRSRRCTGFHQHDPASPHPPDADLSRCRPTAWPRGCATTMCR